MNYQRRIIADPKIMVGKPVIAGTRITVELILEMLAQGVTIEQVLHEYPHLKKEDIKAALEFAKTAVKKERANYPEKPRQVQI